MTTANEQSAARFLRELKRLSQEAAGVAVSMYEVGAEAGLSRDQAEMAAEELIVEGLAELVSLSGTIALTEAGLDGAAAAAEPPRPTPGLGDSQVLPVAEQELVAAVIQTLKTRVWPESAKYEAVEELVFDLRCLELQLLSPRPKTTVVKALLRELAAGADDLGAGAVRDQLRELIGE